MLTTSIRTEAALSSRHAEVDVARLLLLINRFALPLTDSVRNLACFPDRPTVRYFTPEYYLQKLDFLLRYPAYFAYEIIELHRQGIPEAADRERVMSTVREILADEEPDQRTDHYMKFLRGAYERLDEVELWWYSRDLVYTKTERRAVSLDSTAPPQKYYFLTDKGERVAENLIVNVAHASWYDERIILIKSFFGGLTASQVKALQYRHPKYKQAQLAEEIPDLPIEELIQHFSVVFGEPLGVNISE